MNSLRKLVPEPLKALRRWFIALGRLPSLLRRVEDLTVSVQQLRVLVEELGGDPLPPKDLQVRVVGAYSGNFLQSGRQEAADIEAVLHRHSLSLMTFQRILDFGCGCGRVLRCLPSPGPHLAQERFGADIDAEAIAWCDAHYRRYGRFVVSPSAPPSGFPDSFFDFIYSISVFTHLPEQMQFAWLQELRRIMKPGGYLLASLHGENHFARMSRSDRARLDRSGFAYAETGRTAGLPDFYQTAWHSPRYVRDRWAEFFDVIDILPVAIGAHQDAALCRRRTSDSAGSGETALAAAERRD